MIVADTNLIAYLLVDGSQSEWARQTFARDPEWFAPPLWRSEMLNVLVQSVRGGVLSDQQAFATWRRSSQLMHEREVEPNPEAAMKLALRHGISAYDAQFLALAVELGCTLVTADKAMQRAMAAELNSDS